MEITSVQLKHNVWKHLLISAGLLAASPLILGISNLDAAESAKVLETYVALIGIIVENSESTAQLNALLHDAGQYIIGRMGLPYRAKGVSIISVVLDAPQDVISALAGRIGRLPGVSAKTAYSKPFPAAGD